MGTTESIRKLFGRQFVVLEATTGQNALAQAKEFNEVADITGVIPYKDGRNGKGGNCSCDSGRTGIPVKYIGVGETIDDLQKFDADESKRIVCQRMKKMMILRNLKSFQRACKK